MEFKLKSQQNNYFKYLYLGQTVICHNITQSKSLNKTSTSIIRKNINFRTYHMILILEIFPTINKTWSSVIHSTYIYIYRRIFFVKTMAGGGGGGSPTLLNTPTWALATVCFIFIFFGIFIEHLIHLLSHVSNYMLLYFMLPCSFLM